MESPGDRNSGLNAAPASAGQGDRELRFGVRRDFNDCVHCGLCLNACPTYLELAQEPDSPRGRIHLMKAMAEGQLEASPELVRHLDLCLGCRACETACPSGVSYGHLIGMARDWLGRRSDGGRGSAFQNWLIGRIMPDPGLFRFMVQSARLASRLGLARFGSALLPSGFDAAAWTRRLKPQPRVDLPALIPAVPPVRGRVALLTGCVMHGLFGETNAATARVLSRQGWEVRVPRGQVCCGALPAHSGMMDRTRELASLNARVFALEEVDYVVTNAAGCGAMLKEYARLLSGTKDVREAGRLAVRARDVSEVLEMNLLREPLNEIRARATYHDACHLAHGQKVTVAPRTLLAQIPGLELVPLPESDVCCGSAGTYNITEPEMAARLGARKAANILSTGADLVVAGNVGCMLQIVAALEGAFAAGATTSADRIPRVVHTIELLDEATAAESHASV